MSKVFIRLPQSVIELQKELITHHPTLCKVLSLIPDQYDRFAAIATHCDMLLEGMYSSQEIADIADKLLIKLKDKREIRQDSILLIH